MKCLMKDMLFLVYLVNKSDYNARGKSRKSTEIHNVVIYKKAL